MTNDRLAGLRHRAGFPDLRVTGQVLSTELGVVTLGHSVVLAQVPVKVACLDGALREHPFLGNLFAREDLRCGKEGRTPLEVRVHRSKPREARFLPLAQEAHLVFTRHDGVIDTSILECLDCCDGAVTGIHPDSVYVTLGELIRDECLDLCGISTREVVNSFDACFFEEHLSAGPTLLQHVNTGQDTKADDLVSRLEVLDEELSGVDAPRESTDRVDERDGAVGVDATVKDDDGLVGRACALNCRSHCRRAVGITGLARSTVSNRVDALLAVGLVHPAGEAVSTGGRPPARVAFNPLAGVVIAVDLGATHATIAVTDLSGQILDSETRTLDIADGPEAVLDAALAEGARLLEKGDHDASRLAGIGIGVPGPVEHSTGRPTNPPIMPGWDRFDVPGYVQRTFDVPVLVDNDVNILALGEHALSWPGVDDLIFVKVSTGIGAGIIAGGVLQRGAQGSAGDMGHVQVPHSHDSPRPPDDERDLEAIASGSAIAASLRADGVDASSSSDVVQLVRAGNAAAMAATRQAGREVGEVLATVVNMLNPSIIVIGGSVASAGEHLLAGGREGVYRRSIPLATQHLGIVQSQAGARAGVLGAAIMVTQHVLTPSSVDARAAGSTTTKL